MFHSGYTCSSLPYGLREVSVEVACFNTEDYDGDSVMDELSNDLLRSFPGMKIEHKSLSYHRVQLSLLSINNITIGRTKVFSQLCPVDTSSYTGSPEMIACLHDAIRPCDWKPIVPKQKVVKLVEDILTRLEVKGLAGWHDFIQQVSNIGELALNEFNSTIIASLYYARSDKSIAALIFTFHLILTPRMEDKIYAITTQGEKGSIARLLFDKFASTAGEMNENDFTKFLLTAKDLIPNTEKASLAPENLLKTMNSIKEAIHAEIFDPECFVKLLISTRILQEAEIAVLEKRYNREITWGLSGSDVLCFRFGRRSLCLLEDMFNELDLNDSGAIEEREMKEYLKVITKQTNEVVLESAYQSIMKESENPDQRTLFMNFSGTNTISLDDFKMWYAIYTNCEPENFLEPLEKMFLFKYRRHNRHIRNSASHPLPKSF